VFPLILGFIVISIAVCHIVSEDFGPFPLKRDRFTQVSQKLQRDGNRAIGR